MQVEKKPPDHRSLNARIESLLTRDRAARFQLWQPLLLAVLSVAAVVLFGAFALRGAEKHAGVLSQSMHAIAEGPRIAHRMIRDLATGHNALLAKEQRFKGQSGFSIASKTTNGSLLLLARYDGDIQRGVIDVVSVDDGKVVRTYRPDADAINARSGLDPKVLNLKRDRTPRRYLPYHPMPGADGSLIFHSMDSPLVKIDACSRIVWTLDGIFHHSIERDAAGDYWVPANLPPPVIKFVEPDFQDDTLVKVSPDGEILFRKSVSEMLLEAGLDHIVYSREEYQPDPIHLNDIQPVLADGPYWRKGDLFLSLRNPSMLALYRPSTNELIWSKQGPWLMQHDVDIVSDHEIAVFNNNVVAAPSGLRVRDTNHVLVYDFATGKARRVFDKGFARHEIRTQSSGLFTFLDNGAIMVEGQNYGHLLAFDPSGATRWSFVNRAQDGRVYQLGWSRIVQGEQGAALAAAIENADCGDKATAAR